MSLKRADLQQLANRRLREARVLRRNKHYEGCYYLAGLAIECALKACIARKTRKYDFPDKQVVNDSYTHDLAKLLKTAGLERDLANASKSDPNLESNWAVVKDWKIESRYDFMSKQKANELYNAIAARTHGVLSWIKRQW